MPPIKDAVVKKPAANVTLSAAEGEAMIARLAVYAPSRSDSEMLIQVVRWYFWLVWTVQEAKLSLNKLRMLLFGRSSKPPTPSAPEASWRSTPSPGNGEATGASSSRDAEGGPSVEAGPPSGPVASGIESPPTPKGGHRPGTGRLGAEAYEGAERVECRHEALAVGQRCPVCGQGTLYALPPGVEMRLDGHALLSAIRYELEKLRCSACGQIFTAPLPEEAGPEKYSARARAVLTVGRYYLGLPLYRLAGYQQMLGVPVPDATQWDLRHEVARVAVMTYAIRT